MWVGFSDWIFADDSGAVTVDWTVLTAAIVGMGLASAAAVQLGVGSLGDGIRDALSQSTVAALGTLGGDALGGGCDWLCAYSAFLAVEEPNFTVEEFGMTVEQMAQARWDEFEGYSRDILIGHIGSLESNDWQNQPEPYRTYYGAEYEAIRTILEARGEPL